MTVPGIPPSLCCYKLQSIESKLNLGIALVSGGLDSSIVLGTMSQLTPNPVLTYTTGFEGDAASEVASATSTARYYAADHHEVVFTTQQYLDATRELVAYRDGPLGVPNEAAV